MTEDLGPFTGLAANAGSLIAAAGAIGFTFRRRAAWQPAEQDLPKGAERLSGLLIAVFIAILWVQRDEIPAGTFARWAIVLSVASILMLLVYGLFVGVLTKNRRVPINDHEARSVKIVGGFWLTARAREYIAKNGKTVQATLDAAGNEPDEVWPPLSRALAKMCFVLCYILLVATGTVALTCASLVLEAREREQKPATVARYSSSSSSPPALLYFLVLL